METPNLDYVLKVTMQTRNVSEARNELAALKSENERLATDLGLARAAIKRWEKASEPGTENAQELTKERNEAAEELATLKAECERLAANSYKAERLLRPTCE